MGDPKNQNNSDKTAATQERIAEWLRVHPDSFVTFSGGKDSTVLLDLVRRIQPEPRVAFFDTGLNYTQTLDFIRNIQRWWNIEVAYIRTTPTPIQQIAASKTLSYEPSAYDLDFHSMLIEDYLTGAQERFGTIYSLYGLRASESKGRSALLRTTKGYVTKHDRSGALTASSLAPLWDWSEKDINSYIVENRVPMNTAYRRMRELGIPPKKRRTGVVVGDGILLGDWAVNYQIDPSLGNLLESHFPLLRDYR